MADRPKPPAETNLDIILKSIEPFSDEFFLETALAELKELRAEVMSLRAFRDKHRPLSEPPGSLPYG